MGQAAATVGVECCADAEGGGEDSVEPVVKELSSGDNGAAEDVEDYDGPPVFATATLSCGTVGTAASAGSSMASLMTVDLTKTDHSTEPVRGIALGRTLQGLGRLWRHRPASLSLEQRAKIYSSSEPVDGFDVFISHTWMTPGRGKFLSLLVHYSWPYLLMAWAVGTVLSSLLCLLDVLPLFHSWEVTVLGYEQDVPVGCWIMLGSLIFTLAAFIAFPHLPSAKPVTCFVDVACINQVDEVRMRRGIENIGVFLAASAELRVLWSSPYLSRLWCVFELAAYRKVNPEGNITIAPIFFEIVMCRIFVFNNIASWTLWYFRAQLMWMAVWFLCFGALLFPWVHSLRHACMYKQDLVNDLAEFDLQNVHCLRDMDKTNIYAAIKRWYGTLDSFTEFVRGPFRQEVQELTHTPRSMPLGYLCVLATPLLTMSLDAGLCLWQAGAPSMTILAYALSMVSLDLFWLPAVIVIALTLCERFARPRSCQPVHLLQTGAMCLVIWFLVAVGAMCGTWAYQGAFWRTLVWTAVGPAFAGITWRLCRGYSP